MTTPPAPAAAGPQPRPARAQHVFVVDRTERLGPHLVRVHLGGPAFDDFVAGASPDRLGAADKYVKLLFARPDLGLTPPYDLDALRGRLAPEDMPVRRTYTVRAVDPVARTITIDFVVHGDAGVAGVWAASARPGDTLALSGPGGGHSPTADPATWHLLVADDSALPAVAAVLEALPAAASGRAFVEVDGPEDELPLAAPDGVVVRWLHRRGPDGAVAGAGALLTDAVRGLSRPSRPVAVFAHGERGAMQAIRAILQDGWGIERRAMSLSAYWALGRAEDRFQAEKREPVGQIFAD
ncbi:siderophore-interacting protein [Curtobacterium sp. MCBD17_040]|uniref:siderophore-interacting protein n=1 Tax=Curtobacterium sp. MCBD17_040 TaxID=2175674 RepID=UPI000DA89A35|nr:siderophore-interacting protein [Curtobacterium sp. MCBD17_040]WIB62515.1 siderophore-interacting protein [Curtobacterium sp. MCBD17_040]